MYDCQVHLDFISSPIICKFKSNNADVDYRSPNKKVII